MLSPPSSSPSARSRCVHDGLLVAAVAVGRRVLVPAQVVGRGEHRPRQQRVALRAGGTPAWIERVLGPLMRADDSLAPRCDPASSLACCSTTRALPPRAALFQARAMLRAARLKDDWALQSSTRPADVAELLRLARGRRARSSSAPPPAGPRARCCSRSRERRLTSFDPVVREHREAYLALLPRSARERLELVPAPGHEAQGDGHRPAVRRLLARPRRHRRRAARVAAAAGARRARRAARLRQPRVPGRRGGRRRARARRPRARRAVAVGGARLDRRSFPGPRGLCGWVQTRSQGVNHASQQAIAIDGDRVDRAVRVARRDERRGRVLRAQRGQGRRLRRRQGQLEHEQGGRPARRRQQERPEQGQDPGQAPRRRRRHADVRALVRRRRQRAGRAADDRRRRHDRHAHRDVQRPVAARRATRTRSPS